MKAEVRKPRPEDKARDILRFVDSHSLEGNKKQVGLWVLSPASQCENKLCQYIAAADALHSAIPKAPKTVSQYSEFAQSALESLPKTPHWGGGVGHYMSQWTVRSYTLCLMQRDGVSRIALDNACAITQLLSMNPDMTEGLIRAQSHLKATKGFRNLSCKQFLKACKAGRPELYSMWLCFAVDVGLTSNDFSKFNVQNWRRTAQTLFEETGVPPHPSVSCSASCSRGCCREFF